jgi:hypothetical protein
VKGALVAFCLVVAATAHAASQNESDVVRQFISFVRGDSTLLQAGVIPQLTATQLETLQTLRACRARLAPQRSDLEALVVWECGQGRELTGTLTKLRLSGAQIASIEIEQLTSRAVQDR